MFEVHVRPMLLPSLRGNPTSLVEVDVWQKCAGAFPTEAKGIINKISFYQRVTEEYVVSKEDWRQFADYLVKKYAATLVIEEEP